MQRVTTELRLWEALVGLVSEAEDWDDEGLCRYPYTLPLHQAREEARRIAGLTIDEVARLERGALI